MKARHNNAGLRKSCTCSRRNWAKCPHGWYFNFKLRHGQSFRFSLDAEFSRHIKDKGEAQKLADDLRTQIRNGTFIRAADRAKLAAASPAPTTPDAVTVEKFAEIYIERVSQASGKKSWGNDESYFAQLCAFELTDGSKLGAKALGAITEDDLEAFMAHLRAKGRAASTRNGYVQLLRASMRWAVKKKYLTRSPISDDSAALKRSKHAQRDRRLEPDVLDKDGKVKAPGEERRLLDAAGPHLYNLIVAALETACRRGELLSLQWRDVSVERRELTIRATKAKDHDTRVLPISDRLLAVLKMVQNDPGGDPYKPLDYVFGVCGQQVENVKRAWETAVLKAHGFAPAWHKTGLGKASREALKGIDLHFHDLRHEAGSRLAEAGWPMHHVQAMLGHASLEQTSTYLNWTAAGLQKSMAKIDDARSRCNPVAKEASIEHPLVCNDSERETSKALVN